MKNDLTCAVVADLLPSFVEGLTSEESNRAVEAHVASCPACAAKLAAMGGPETETAVEVVPEVDYLKKVKKRTGRKVILAVLCTVAVIVLGCAVKLFLIGEPADGAGMAWTYEQTPKTLHLNITALDSAMTYRDWDINIVNGQAVIRAKKVLVSPIFNSGYKQLDIPLDGLTMVYLGETLIWKDGMSISEAAWDIYEAQTPYVGNASAVSQLLRIIDFWHGPIGEYSISLQTAAQPYGMTVELKSPQLASAQTEKMLELYSARLLVLVGNLDQVTWNYTDFSGTALSDTFTQADIQEALRQYAEAMHLEHYLKDDLKDYASSIAEFQKLCDLDIH